MDEATSMKTSFTLVPLLLLGLIFPVRAADRAALIIGIDLYEHLPASAQLRVAVSDAELLADTLSNLPLPFEVTLLTNANREVISQGLDRFVDTAKNAQCALIYFAGHGIEFHGENYLLAGDTKITSKPGDGVRRVKERLYYHSLSLGKLMENLNETDANLQIVILDACRNNPLEIETPGGTRSIMGSKGGLGKVNAPSGMLISYAADSGQQANDGMFTAILSQQIKLPGSTLMEVFAKTRSEVRKQTKVLEDEQRGVLQEPAEYSKLEPSALRFSFVAGQFGNVPPPVNPMPRVQPPPTGSMQKKIVETKIRLAKLNSQMETDRQRHKESMALINKLTHNLRRPLKVGTVNYERGMAAQNVVLEIKERAPEMITEKAKLEAVLKALGVKVEE